MKSILIVDDDPLILRVYGQGLKSEGFEVATAADGLDALRILRSERPDAIVLDLLMPRLSGVDVLNFVRSTPDLARVPVVLLSGFMGELAKTAPGRYERALLKLRCTPLLLAETIRELIERGADICADDSLNGPAEPLESGPGAAPSENSIASSMAAPAAQPTVAPGEGMVAPDQVNDLTPGIHFQKPAAPVPTLPHLNPSEEFLARAFATAAELRGLYDACLAAATESAQRIKAQDLCRRVHFLAAAAGLAHFALLAEAASSVTAFLFEIGSTADLSNPSLLRTTGQAIDFLVESLTSLPSDPGITQPRPAAFVVAPETISRPLGPILSQAGIAHWVFADTDAVVQAAHPESFIYFVLDSELPRQKAWKLRQELRARNQQGFAIFLLDRTHYDIRAASPPEPGLEYVLKPVFPMEVTLKILLHWLRHNARGEVAR